MDKTVMFIFFFVLFGFLVTYSFRSRIFSFCNGLFKSFRSYRPKNPTTNVSHEKEFKDFNVAASELSEKIDNKDGAAIIIDNNSANLKDSEDKDCDVTYKTDYNVYNNSAFSRIDAASASNDDKNTPKYHPTALQDVYPTDLA